MGFHKLNNEKFKQFWRLRSNEDKWPYEVKWGHMTQAEIHALATRPQSQKPRQNDDQ